MKEVICPKCHKPGELHDRPALRTIGRHHIAYVLHTVPHSDLRRTCHLTRTEREALEVTK